VEMIIEGNTILIKWVVEYVSETEGLSFVHGLRWVATGIDVNQVVIILERWEAKRVEWVNRRGQQFDTANPEVVLFTTTLRHRKHLRPTLTAMIRVGNGSIRFNEEASRRLGDWMHAHLMFKEHNNRCMKKARVAEARLRSLTKTYGVVPESIQVVHMVCD
jgi:hypothetical protein